MNQEDQSPILIPQKEDVEQQQSSPQIQGNQALGLGQSISNNQEAQNQVEANQQESNQIQISIQQSEEVQINLAMSSAYFQETNINEQINVLVSLIRKVFLELLLHFTKALLGLIALNLINSSCKNDRIFSFIVLGTATASIAILLQIFLLFHLIKDKKQLSTHRQNANLNYSQIDMMSSSHLFEAFSRRHPGYKICRLIYLWYQTFEQYPDSIYLTLFIYGNTSICSNSENDTNFIWAVVFILLILSYLGIGLPVGLMLLYIIFVVPFIFCFACVTDHRQGINRSAIQKLKVTVLKEGEILTDENICIICLDEFKGGAEIITLPCHKYHCFHRECILQWFTNNDLCPLCKQKIG